jgi:hypothetical protein
MPSVSALATCTGDEGSGTVVAEDIVEEPIVITATREAEKNRFSDLSKGISPHDLGQSKKFNLM